jgi:hypothetical protein
MQFRTLLGCWEGMQVRILPDCLESLHFKPCLVIRNVCSPENCLICLEGMQFRTACFFRRYGSYVEQCLVLRKVCSSEHCLICLEGMQFRTDCFFRRYGS